MFAGWRSQQWLLPEVIPEFGPDTVTWRLPFASLLPTDSVRRLADLYGQDFDGLDSHERLALVIADVEGGVTNVRMQFVSDLHPADLSKMLRSLVSRGVLVATGRTSATVYSLSKSGSVPTSSTDSSHIAGDSSQTIRRPLDEKQIEALRRKIYPHGWRRQFARAVQVKDAILLICADRFATAAEIAATLGRNPNNLRSRYLTPMVGEGSLRLLYSRDLNRPDQAYIAVTPPKDE